MIIVIKYFLFLKMRNCQLLFTVYFKQPQRRLFSTYAKCYNRKNNDILPETSSFFMRLFIKFSFCPISVLLLICWLFIKKCASAVNYVQRMLKFTNTLSTTTQNTIFQYTRNVAFNLHSHIKILNGLLLETLPC